MEKTAKYLVKGFSNNVGEFEEELLFTLSFPKENESHYGTGCYMGVEWKNSHNRQSYDVRYERTTDIDVLAKRIIESYYGKNAKDVIKLN